MKSTCIKVIGIISLIMIIGFTGYLLYWEIEEARLITWNIIWTFDLLVYVALYLPIIGSFVYIMQLLNAQRKYDQGLELSRTGMITLKIFLMLHFLALLYWVALAIFTSVNMIQWSQYSHIRPGSLTFNMLLGICHYLLEVVFNILLSVRGIRLLKGMGKHRLKELEKAIVADV